MVLDNLWYRIVFAGFTSDAKTYIAKTDLNASPTLHPDITTTYTMSSVTTVNSPVTWSPSINIDNLIGISYTAFGSTVTPLDLSVADGGDYKSSYDLKIKEFLIDLFLGISQNRCSCIHT